MLQPRQRTLFDESGITGTQKRNTVVSKWSQLHGTHSTIPPLNGNSNQFISVSETFLCSTFALQLKTVLLLDVLQLLMLSAGTLMSLQDKMFPLNTFHCKQDTVCMLAIYLLVCVHNFSFIIIIFLFVLLFY
jgi:hypothetical protein